MSAEPAATAVTAIVVVVTPPCIVAVGEPTVATLVLVELTLNTRPPVGAGPERVNVRFWLTVLESERLDGERLIVAVTWTALVVEVYPDALAVMFAVPGLFPVTCGCAAGCVWPASMVTVPGAMPTFDESLVSVTVTPPWGAAVGSVTANAFDSPSASVTFDGRPMDPALATVTLPVAFTMFAVVAAAVTVAVPGATPVTCTVAVLVFCAVCTVAGTVIARVSLKSFVSKPVSDRLVGTKLNVVLPVTG